MKDITNEKIFDEYQIMSPISVFFKNKHEFYRNNLLL